MGVCHSSTNGTSATDSSSSEKPPSPLPQPLSVVPFTSIQNLSSDSESERVLSTSLPHGEETSKPTSLILHQDRHALATLFSFISTKERVLTIGRVCHLWLTYSVDPIAWAQDRYVLLLHPSRLYPDDISVRYRPLIRSVRLCGGVGGIKTAGSVEVSRMMNLSDLTGLTELTISDFGIPTNIVNEMAGLLYKAGMSLEPQADGSHQENSRRRSIQTLILTLSANQTHHLHPLFTSPLFRHLQQLHIRHLHVSQVESIGYLQELRELKLQEAHLSEVWNVIHQLPVLDTLAIDSCDPITTRPLPISLTSLTLAVTESELVNHPVFSSLSMSPPRHLQFLDLSITHKVIAATAVRPTRRLVQHTVVKVHTKPYPPGLLGIKSNPPIPDTVANSVPHPRLVGVETNPGPQNSTTASSSHTPMDKLSSIANRNHHIRLHQDRAVLPLCLAFLECGEIVRSLGVCHYWKEATKNRQVWAHCTYQLRSGPLRLASMYHPFILRLHVHGPATHLLESNSLALFSRLTSFELEQTVEEDDYWDKKLLPTRYHTLFGLLPPTNEANTSASFTVAAPTITTTTSTVSSLDTFKLTGWVHECALPLHIILPHPRFAHLNHLFIGEVYTTLEDVMAIRILKHLQTLSLFGDDPKAEWNGRSDFFEILHQLPLFNSLAIGYLPAFKNGKVVPLPPTITDLSLTGLQTDPLVSFTSKLIGLKSCRLGVSVMCRHQADDFGDWYDWMKWFAELTSLETFEVDITDDCGLVFIGLLPHLLTPENRSNLNLYQMKCDEEGIKQLILKRAVPSSSTHASDHSIQPSHARFTPIAQHSLDYHPLYFFEYIRATLAHVVELDLVGFTLSSLIVDSLSHLPRASDSLLESFKLDADRANFVLGQPGQPVKVAQDVLEKFFGIIGQQIHLRKLVLCGSWLHGEQFTSKMGDSLAPLEALEELHLNTLIHSECSPICTAILNHTISQLSHLKQLYLTGSCLLHTDNLRLLSSRSMQELHCTMLIDERSNDDHVLMTHQQLSDLFASLPHLLTSLHQRPTHAKVVADHDRDSPSTSASDHHSRVTFF